MILLLGLVLFLIGANAGAASRRAWLPWLLPLLVACYFVFSYVRELQPPEQGENNPGLVLLIGVAAVIVAAGGVAFGRLSRRRVDGRS